MGQNIKTFKHEYFTSKYSLTMRAANAAIEKILKETMGISKLFRSSIRIIEILVQLELRNLYYLCVFQYDKFNPLLKIGYEPLS